jgi:hypothetical protein
LIGHFKKLTLTINLWQNQRPPSTETWQWLIGGA